MTDSVLDTLSQLEAGIAELTSESVVILDEQARVRYWNPAAERLFGWPLLTVRRSDIFDLSASPDAEEAAWQQLLHEGQWQGRISRRSRDGRPVLADVRRHLRPKMPGDPIEIVEFARPARNARKWLAENQPVPDRMMAASWEIDVAPAERILERIATLAAHAGATELDDLYRKLVDASKIVEVNERTARLVGGNRGPKLMAGQSVSHFWPAGSRAVLARLIVDILGSEGPAIISRQLPSDGILRDPLVTVWRASADWPGRLFISVNGAADDDRSFLFLRASEARYRKLVDYMPVALWQVDASEMGRIYAGLRSAGVVDLEQYLNAHPELAELAASSVSVTDVNQSAVELFGASSAQELMRPVGYLFSESQLSLRHVMVGRFSGRKSHNELMKVRTFDNRVLDVRFSVTYPEPLLELDTTIFSLEDVTERLQLERQLHQLQADFSHAARIATLGELTSSIAHEVNQPLAAIVTSADASLRWLRRDQPDVEKVQQLTKRIAANARRADAIVQRIRGMATKRPAEPTTLQFSEVIQESLHFVRHEIETRAIRVTISLADRMERVVGDRIQLQQVVVNLLMNAMQAVEEQDEADREIDLRTEVDSTEKLLFTIGDRGCGIASEHLDQIFDGFFTTKARGMGLGLAICRSIVQAHGGNLSACNRPEGGAEFQVALPRASD